VLNLYLIERPFTTVGYDQCRGFVIAAQSVPEARLIAARTKGCEHAAVWFDPATPCTHIGVALAGTAPGVVLTSFRAG
jgi:hypothetical protein